MNYTMDKTAGNVFTAAIIVLGITIVVTAFVLSPTSCVDEKVEIATLTQSIAELRVARAEIQPGTCHFYPAQSQEVCRQASHSGGALYVRERQPAGADISPEDGANG